MLQYITFSHLRVLKFLFAIPRVETLIKFLEINGDHDNSLNLAVAKFCPSLKNLITLFEENELETLKIILNNCQYLESIRVWCGEGYLNDKEFLNVLDLEEFFINWKNRISQNSLSLTIYKNFDGFGLESNVENMEIIKKYMKLGIIDKFITKEYDYFEY
uniref:Uncharacterized protein n=1 Tax=Rhizophagus irregularis (strain DAOM 181602 / DAOM 197198 / MUCL 43194) TaxID=747089 RepID=U9SX77_RHIID